MSGYRGRFAPSPTGAIHWGTARTALVAWLRARAEGGAFILRIEDLDAPRVRPGAAEAQLSDLEWLGLDWDEGPDTGGSHAPYVQSQRLERYERALDLLVRAGHAYPCTCSRKEIAEIASAPHGEEPRYPGTCRNGPSHPERTPSWRFRFERGEPFRDVLFGPSSAGIDAGDFVVKRADGLFAYQLAVVVDDLEMEITEVVRGADLLSSTPRQIALARALGRTAPAFFHVPLILGADGQRLAKRHGSISIAETRARGVTPERVTALLAASLGLTDRDEIAPGDLVRSFDPQRIPRSDASLPL